MPKIGTHPSAQALAHFAHGKLSEDQAATVAAHLKHCADCRQAVAGVPPDSFPCKVRAARPSGTQLPPGPAPAPSAPLANVPPELANHPKFRIVRELGRGGMGVIYLAEHRVLEKHVALKVISPAVLDNPDALARFHAEARAAAQLDHPNIARAHDADQAGDLHFLVMEFVEGVSLAQLVEKKGPLQVAHACHYVRQAALGLQHASEMGMVHRDIKPQNLMVTPRGVVKVLDFGLARLRSEQKGAVGLTRADSFMGTPEYVAPEQAKDARSADTRADIYSLGCTLYVLLTGRPPFVEDTAVKLVLAHIEKEPRPLHELRADVPAGLSAVVAKMLAKEPSRRYPHPVEVAQALEPFVKAVGKPITAAGASGPPRVAASGTGTIVGGTTSRIQGLAPEAVELFPREPVSGSESETPCGVGVDDVSPPTRPHSAVAGTKAAALAVAKRLLSLPWLILIFLFGFLPWSEVSCESWQAQQSGYQAVYGGVSSSFDSLGANRDVALQKARTNQRALSMSLETEHTDYLTACSPFLVLFWASALVMVLAVCLTPLGRLRLGLCLTLAGLMAVMLVVTLVMGMPFEQRIHTAVLAAYRVDSVPGLKMTPESPSVKTVWFWLTLGAVVLVGATEAASNLLWRTVESVRMAVLVCLAAWLGLLVTTGVGTQLVLWQTGLTAAESRLAELHRIEQEEATRQAQELVRAEEERQRRADEAHAEVLRKQKEDKDLADAQAKAKEDARQREIERQRIAALAWQAELVRQKKEREEQAAAAEKVRREQIAAAEKALADKRERDERDAGEPMKLAKKLLQDDDVYKNDNAVEARKLLRKIVKDWPNTKVAVEAKGMLPTPKTAKQVERDKEYAEAKVRFAKKQIDDGMTDLAKQGLEAVVKDFGETEAAVEARKILKTLGK